MAQRPALSRSETDVARTLWALGKGTAREVYEALPEATRGEFSTIQTYLARLENKGYLASEKLGRTKVYKPKVKRSLVIRETVDDLVNRLFGGQAFPLLKHLINERSVTPDELGELRELLAQLEAESGESGAPPSIPPNIDEGGE